MSRFYAIGRLRALPPVVCILMVCPMRGGAQSDYHDKDFSVRMASAFIRFTEVSALGGETAANRYSSAINPATVGWTPLPGKFGLVAAPYYSTIEFDEGARLHVTGESLTWDTRSWGTFQPTVSQIRSNRSQGSDELSFDYEVDIAQLQWGKRFGDLGLGTCFNFARTQIDRRGALGPSPPVEVDVDASAESYRWRFGGLYQPAKKWLLGTILEYGFQPYRSRADTWIPLVPPAVAMGDSLYDDGIQQQFIVRPGVSYEYAPMSSVYADYQYGVFFNHNDTLNSHIFIAGIEHRLLQMLFVRAGPTLDARGNVGVRAGASLFLSTWCSLDLGYQYNTLSELRPEFGRATSLQATLSFRF